MTARRRHLCGIVLCAMVGAPAVGALWGSPGPPGAQPPPASQQPAATPKPPATQKPVATQKPPGTQKTPPAAPAGEPPALPPALARHAPAYPDTAPVRSCESLTGLAIPHTTIDAAVLDSGVDGEACRVTATVTHPPAGDRVKVWVALPVSAWNGRFMGVGGGGLSGGSEGSLRAPAAAGYAAGATDTGHEGGSGSFALDASGRYNWMLIRDNAYLGIHDMTVTAKALVSAFYGKAPRYSYFNGCSTGGRQGLSEAQRYPADYDGILSGAPAINFAQLHVAQMWGPLAMLEAKYVVPMCRFAAATEAAVAACDGDDGQADGVIDDPARCAFDPMSLVGTTAPGCGTFLTEDAAIIRRIWEGPKRQDGTVLWHGLTRGSAFSLSTTGGTPPAPRPFGITLDWFRYFLTQNPSWDFKTLTPGAYEQFWDQSIEQFDAVLGTNNPDLSAFRARGGRIVLWHGLSDPLIYPGGTIDYVTRVRSQMGGAARVSEFLRFFLAPGVGHCGGGAGPVPAGQFDAVVRWVEQGRAPETLLGVRRDESGAVIRTRPLCEHPRVARYTGRGNPDEASSFACRAPR